MISVKSELRKRALHPKKGLGQNFLIDNSIAEKITEIAEVDKDDSVIEIGAGLGVLTSILSDRAREVFAIELDRDIFDILKKNLSNKSNVYLFNEDALLFNYRDLVPHKMKVVANLPYSIATEIIFKLLGNKELFSLMVLMIQKEVALRFTAKPNSKEYGTISILSQLQSDMEIAMTVSNKSFYPPPKVSSAILKIKPLSETRIPIKDYEWFSKVVRGSFFNRRKMIKNSLFQSKLIDLSSSEISKILLSTGIDPKRRGESLTIEEFANLSTHLLPYKR
jgi:16S rRNA (adenine1518-N6/adenine1519-N6)-dimethyltransferase